MVFHGGATVLIAHPLDRPSSFGRGEDGHREGSRTSARSVRASSRSPTTSRPPSGPRFASSASDLRAATRILDGMPNLERAKRHIQGALAETAGGFLDLGLQRFLAWRGYSPIAHTQPQTTIGLLGVGCELLVKALIARIALVGIYCPLPQDLQLALVVPDGSYASKTVARRRDISSRLLDDHSVKTVEFGPALSAAKLLVPKIDKNLHGYLANIPALRNRSVHGSLSPLEHHHVEWVAFAAIALHRVAVAEGLGLPDLPSGAEGFSRSFDEKRAERVEKEIAKARSGLIERIRPVSQVRAAYSTSEPRQRRDATLLQAFPHV